MSFIHNNKNRGNILVGLFALSGMGLFLAARETVLQSVKASLLSCASFVVPAIFPFLVLSYVFTETPCALLFGRLLHAPCRRIFKLSPCGVSALLLGLVSGFPVGAKCAADLCAAGKIGRDECARLSAFATCPSPAFVIGVVGGTLYRSIPFGVVLYGVIVLLSLACGAVLARGAEAPALVPEESDLSPEKPFALLLCTAIGESAIAMVKVCAFVVFFGAAAAVLLDLSGAFFAAPVLRGVVLSFFEFSRGCSAAPDLAVGRVGGAVAAFALGWGGLSVQAQVASFMIPIGISSKAAIAAKMCIGLLAALIVYLVYPLCGASPLSADLPAVKMLGGTGGAFGLVAIGAAAIVYFLICRQKRKKSADF